MQIASNISEEFKALIFEKLLPDSMVKTISDRTDLSTYAEKHKWVYAQMENAKSNNRAQQWDNKKGANDMQIGGLGQPEQEQDTPGPGTAQTFQQMMEALSAKTTVDTLNALKGRGSSREKGVSHPTRAKGRMVKEILKGVSRAKGGKAQGNPSMDGASIVINMGTELPIAVLPKMA